MIIKYLFNRELRRKIFSDVNSRLTIPHRKELEKEISIWKKEHSLDKVDVPQKEDENIDNLSETIFKEDKQKKYVSYKSEHDYLEEKSDDSYNIVFIGPSGAGKRPLINHLFNKNVLPPTKPLTRSCRYIHGLYQEKPVCIVNTIG